jgi:hypothetical protein
MHIMTLSAQLSMSPQLYAVRTAEDGLTSAMNHVTRQY